MPIYDYECKVKECKAKFSVEVPMSEHQEEVDCPYCNSKACATQIFLPEHSPAVKIWDHPMHKHITFDKE